MKNLNLLSIATALLILLFVYAAFSKLLSFDEFKGQLKLQVLPEWLKPILTWLLPLLELLVAGLLSFNRTKLSGLWCAFVLMSGFTIYTVLVISHALGKIPCACGGVISSLGWTGHLYFNLFFLLVSAIGLIYSTTKTNRPTGPWDHRRN